MSAESVVYYLNRVPESDPTDQTEWLLTALGRPVPAVDSAAGQMTGNITLVSAVKQR